MRTQKIATLNDQLRKSISVGFSNIGDNEVVVTRGVSQLPYLNAIMKSVINYETDYGFNKENDPFSERDFGSFSINHIKFFWKIDYYDKSMEYGSEDPSDPKKTKRILTIMKADEY